MARDRNWSEKEKFGVSPKNSSESSSKKKSSKNGTSKSSTSGSSKSSSSKKQKAEDVALSADTQLAMAKYRRKVKKLNQKLADIEEEKTSELKEIEKETKKMKDETKKLSKKQDRMGLTNKEIESLKEENAALMKKNEKLKTNSRNLRINQMRLEQYSLGNGDYYDQLEKHHEKAKRENKRLTAMEEEWKEKATEADQKYEQYTNGSHVEQRLKKMYRKNAKKMIRKAEAASVDPGLLLKLYDILQDVEKYEEKIDEKIPFSPLKQIDDNGDDEGEVSTKKKDKKSKKKDPTRGVNKSKSSAIIGSSEKTDKSKKSKKKNDRVLTKSNSISINRRASASVATLALKDKPLSARRASTSMAIALQEQKAKKKTQKESKKKPKKKSRKASSKKSANFRVYDDNSSSEEGQAPNDVEYDDSESSGWSSTDSDSRC